MSEGELKEEIDSELTEFVFEDSETVTTIWIDHYADYPGWDEPQWVDNPEAYRNALACGHRMYRKNGGKYFQFTPDWIPASGVAEIKRCIDLFVDGEIDEFGATPTTGCFADELPPIQIAMRRNEGRVFVRFIDNGRHSYDLGHSVEQELTEERLKELQDYFTRINQYWPPR